MYEWWTDCDGWLLELLSCNRTDAWLAGRQLRYRSYPTGEVLALSVVVIKFPFAKSTKMSVRIDGQEWQQRYYVAVATVKWPLLASRSRYASLAANRDELLYFVRDLASSRALLLS